MRTQSIAITAGGAVKRFVVANYFHMLETVSAVDIKFFKDGAIFAEAVGMEAGFYAEPARGFDAFEISSAAAQTVKVATSDGTGGYNRTVGTVSVSSLPAVSVSNLPAVNGAFANSSKTVINTSTQLLAANSARRYLMIQNNDASGDIFVRLDGGTVSGGTGVKIAPGGSYELQGYVPTGAITAVGSIAINANIVTVEG